MNRRKFLQLVSAAVVAAVAPITAKANRHFYAGKVNFVGANFGTSFELTTAKPLGDYLCLFVPPTPGYAPCTREKGHDGPCAHYLDPAAFKSFPLPVDPTFTTTIDLSKLS